MTRDRDDLDKEIERIAFDDSSYNQPLIECANLPRIGKFSHRGGISVVNATYLLDNYGANNDQ
jgi:hypothetical protein